MNKSILFLALSLAVSGAVSASTITPVNLDPDGSGLNDPTAAVPVGLNPGTSVGEQRRIAYQFASDLWGAVLQSNVEIRVGASFQPLTCAATSGVLGSAGATQIFRDFPNAALAATWYHSALADSVAGVELDTDADIDINSRFNSNLGTPGCLESSSWYYGLDGNTPAGAINFLDVVMHEIGHGLGFQGFDSLTTGAFFAGFPNVYGANVFDNVSGQAWNSLTDQGRVNAAVGGNLVWVGTNVTSQVPAALGPLVRMNVTGNLTVTYAFGTASFGAQAGPGNFSGAAVIVDDGSAAPTQGCNALTNVGAIAGNIAVVDRGTCGFAVKAKNAQDAGATGVIVVNNVAGAAPGLGGSDPTVTVPTVSLSQADGGALKASLPGSSVALAEVPGQFSGTDSSGRALLFSPNPVQGGSSFSHYDVSHSPNALMEPSINADLDGNLRVDLSPALYADEGWVINSGNARTRNGTCNTGIPVIEAPGLIGGANLQAADKLCRAQGGNSAAYKSCIQPFVSKLQMIGTLPAGTPGKLSPLNVCLK